MAIGTRVTHYDGGPSTHGLGRIVAYNGAVTSDYVENNLKTASELAEQDEGGIVAQAIFGSFYSGGRYPYVVKFDPSKDYPDGYQDVYCDGSINKHVKRPTSAVVVAN